MATALGALSEAEQTREKEIRQIHQALTKDMPTIVVGDFNSSSLLATPRFMVDNGFTDSFAEVTKNPDRHPTWHWNLNGLNLTFRLDYIFHDKGFSTLQSRVVSTDASDHNLVISRLAVTAGP